MQRMKRPRLLHKRRIPDISRAFQSVIGQVNETKRRQKDSDED